MDEHKAIDLVGLTHYNELVKAALNLKADKTEISWAVYEWDGYSSQEVASNLQLFQNILDDHLAGKSILIINGVSRSQVPTTIWEFPKTSQPASNSYILSGTVLDLSTSILNNSSHLLSFSIKQVKINLDSTDPSIVTSVSVQNDNTRVPFLATNHNYSTPYTPLHDGSPATKKYVDDLIAGIDTLKREIVQTLPTTDIKTDTIYMVPKSTAQTNNIYDEYMYINNAWELIGTTEIDLTNYLAKDNTTAFTPTGDYNPATKKYVDDKLSSPGLQVQYVTSLPTTDIDDNTLYIRTNPSLSSGVHEFFIYDTTQTMWVSLGVNYDAGLYNQAVRTTQTASTIMSFTFKKYQYSELIKGAVNNNGVINPSLVTVRFLAYYSGASSLDVQGIPSGSIVEQTTSLNPSDSSPQTDGSTIARIITPLYFDETSSEFKQKVYTITADSSETCKMKATSTDKVFYGEATQLDIDNLFTIFE